MDRDERLSRFARHEKQLTKSKDKRRLFLPSPADWDLSVFRTSTLLEPAIWQIGLAVVAVNSDTLYGRADLPAIAYLDRHLTLDGDDWGHDVLPGHVGVKGWPPDNDDDYAGAREIAKELSLLAVYVPYP